VRAVEFREKIVSEWILHHIVLEIWSFFGRSYPICRIRQSNPDFNSGRQNWASLQAISSGFWRWAVGCRRQRTNNRSARQWTFGWVFVFRIVPRRQFLGQVSLSGRFSHKLIPGLQSSDEKSTRCNSWDIVQDSGNTRLYLQRQNENQ